MSPTPFHPQPARRAPIATGASKLLAAAALAVMAACGGGTSQYEPFVPERLFAFGDEASALTTTAPVGRNYGINGINGNGTPENTADDYFDCMLQPNWVQSLASFYGFVFAECNPNNAVAKAFNRSAPNARVADVEAQVEAQSRRDPQAADGGLRDKDIATLMVGVNDILELYGRFDGSNEAALVAEAGERGNRAGRVVNRLIALGAKVVVSNIPDLGTSPYALKQNTANPGSDRAGVLSRLSAAFNERLGVTMLIDGRFVALVQTDQRVLVMSRSPASFGLANTTDAVCATPPPDCTNSTLVPGAAADVHLWAGDYLLSYVGQVQIATLAIARAQRNPF